MSALKKRCSRSPKSELAGLSDDETVPVRRSYRLEEQRWLSLGPFRTLPCEILHLILSQLTASSLSQLGQVSRGWQLVLREWLQLKSVGWTLSPARRFSNHTDQFYDEYTHLGLLCRRVLDTKAPLCERAHAVWEVIKKVEAAGVARDCSRHQPGFLGAANMYRAAVPLNCAAIGDRFDAMWQMVTDSTGVDRSVLMGEFGERRRVQETDLRLALRMLFLVPAFQMSNAVTVRRDERARMLRSLMHRLTVAEQARLLFICYGPRSGFIEWRKPCDSEASSLQQMVHIVSELGTVIKLLASCSSQDYIYSLVEQLTRTPETWLPRYQVLLLLAMGHRAAAAVLAGHAIDRTQLSLFVPTRIAQMASVAQLFRQRVISGSAVGLPVLNAASFDFLRLVKDFSRLVPENLKPDDLIDNIVFSAFNLAIEVGGPIFANKVIKHLYPVLEHYQMMKTELVVLQL